MRKTPVGTDTERLSGLQKCAGAPELNRDGDFVCARVCALWMSRSVGHWVHREENATLLFGTPCRGGLALSGKD